MSHSKPFLVLTRLEVDEQIRMRALGLRSVNVARVPFAEIYLRLIIGHSTPPQTFRAILRNFAENSRTTQYIRPLRSDILRLVCRGWVDGLK